MGNGALNALTRCIAYEGGPHGIRANMVSLGFVKGTKFFIDHPELLKNTGLLGTLGSQPAADEIADVVTFLASSRAAHITGEIVNVAGGAYMRN